MPKKNKPKKINRPVEESVNPIVFGCNALVDRFFKSTVSPLLSTTGDVMSRAVADSMYKAIRDKSEVSRKRKLKTIPFTICAYEKVTGTKVDMSSPIPDMNINEYLCNVHVFPGTGCRIRKLSERATQFLLSLGQPSMELRMDYREHLYSEASNRPEEVVQDAITGRFYEELIELPINGHTEYIYLISSTEMCVVLHRRDSVLGENEYFNIPVAPNVRDVETQCCAAGCVYTEDYDNWESGNIFDVEALLANLWISETLRTCEPCPEPEWSKVASDRPVVLAGKKPLKHSHAYRYIHITDETWKRYSSALTSTREYKNFNVPSWLVRAHYARMHGKTVFIKAHFAYRRKGAVNNVEPVDYIV